MINHIYQLVSPQMIAVKCSTIDCSQGIIVRPIYMAICQADQRYFMGKRDPKILKQKLPMALIHECCGEILYDERNIFNKGQKVILMPNIAPKYEKEIFENYAKGSCFYSSGKDGFMQEFLQLNNEQVLPYSDFDENIAVLTEFVSVAVHAETRFATNSHEKKEKIGIWGDGSLSYVVACILKEAYPYSKIFVIGRHEQKLAQFSFVEQTYLSGRLPQDFCVDHVFECCGSEGCFFAIEEILKVINPQGTVLLMGVSENNIGINTRMILEKGLSFIGCSRSGRKDFEKAITRVKNKME